MWVGITSIPVDDQSKAHAFYTEVLGLETRQDIVVTDAGDRYLTVADPEAPNDVELFLEPAGNPGIKINGEPAALVFRKVLVDAGVPWTSLTVEDVPKEYERLTAKGVRFTQEPVQMGPFTAAVFDDTCGNLIMISDQCAKQ